MSFFEPENDLVSTFISSASLKYCVQLFNLNSSLRVYGEQKERSRKV